MRKQAGHRSVQVEITTMLASVVPTTYSAQAHFCQLFRELCRPAAVCWPDVREQDGVDGASDGIGR